VTNDIRHLSAVGHIFCDPVTENLLVPKLKISLLPINLKQMKKLALILLLIPLLKTNGQNIHWDMENWRNVYAGSTQLASPNGWYSDDSVIFMSKFVFPNANYSQQAFKVTSAHSGNEAAKLVTADQDVFGITPGILTNTKPLIDMVKFNNGQNPVVYTGGTNVTERVKTVKAWIKYIPKGADTASIYVEAVLASKGSNGLDSFVDVGDGTAYISDSSSGFTQIQVPISYINPNIIPERLLIFFTSSNNSPQVGSALYIDDVTITTPSGIEQIFSTEKEVNIYPNPTRGTIQISNNYLPGSVLQMYSMTGQLVENFVIAYEQTFDISSLNPGLYHYRVSGKNDLLIDEGKIVLER